MSKYNHLAIEIIDGVLAPRYPVTTKELKVTKTVITTQGTMANKPIVDLQLCDEEGNKFFIAMTGGIFINLAAAVEGAGAREYKAPNKPVN